MFAKHNLIVAILIALLAISFLSACGPTPEVIKVTVVVTATPESQAPTQPVVSAPVEREIAVSAKQGLEYQEEGLPFVYIPPDALDQDTTLRIEQVDAALQQPDTQLAGPAFDITLADGSLRAPIEIALPLTLSDVDPTEGEVFAAYYEDDIGWIALPSWLSEDGQTVHTTLDHLTLVGSFFSLFPKRPRINLKQATPNPFTNVGWPPCFKDDLVVKVDADDPDGEVEKVEVKFSLHTYSTKGLTDLNKFVQSIYGLGLVLEAPGVAATMPAAQTIVTLAKTEDPGIAATEWADMFEDPDQPGVYYASMNLSPISTCEIESWHKADVDAIMAGTGIEKIVADIRVTDDSNLSKEDQIEIYVYSGEPAHAVLFEPGPSKDDILGPRPTFHWEIKGYGSYAARLVYAKGNSLWERWRGKKIIPLEWTDKEWQPDKSLKPGEYVWGVEVSSDEWFRPENTIRSSVYHFTVTGDPIATLSVEGAVVVRSDVENDTGKALGWHVYYEGESVLERNARNESSFDLSDIFSEPGEYTVVLEIYKGKPGKGQYVPISNQVTVIIEEPTLTSTPTLTPTSTPTPVPTPTSTPTPTPTPQENLVKIPSIVGLTPDEAESKLKEAGFGVLPGKDGYSDDVPTGHIYKQEPGAGELYDPKNTVVIIYRSRGRSTPTGGGRIAFVSDRDGNEEIYVMNADGSGQTNLTNHPARDYVPSWSPDGALIAFASERDGNSEIYVMNADGGGQTNLTNNLAGDVAPAWSPDSALIAFESWRDGGNEIYVMNADGSGQTRLTHSPAPEMNPFWSPDGMRIAFMVMSLPDVKGEIYVMNADGSEQMNLTNDPAGDGEPSWSPDGKRIAFRSGRDGNREIYVMNADGSGQTNLTNNPADDWSPSWSSDGRRIAFVSDRDGNWEIYVMNADSSGVTRLTDNPAKDLYPSWSPR
jgi:Tol biopolymer transport system component